MVEKMERIYLGHSQKSTGDLSMKTSIKMTIDNTIKERGARYGSFAGHARITQNIKNIIATGESYSKLDNSQREALEMIAHKIGRIVNGDPNYANSWHDIAGYATLIEQELKND